MKNDKPQEKCKPPSPCKKTCACTILPHPFFSFSGSLPFTPPGEVMKIYFPSIFKGVRGGGGEGSNYPSAQSPCQNENFVNTSKNVLQCTIHVDLFQFDLFPSHYIYFLFTSGHDTDTVKVQVKVQNSVGLKHKFYKTIMKVSSFWRGFS